MSPTEYLLASGLASACVVTSLLMASRDFPRGSLARSLAFALTAAAAAASPTLAWRVAGFARPIAESDLPQEFSLLAVSQSGAVVSVWIQEEDAPMAYSFVPGRSLHDALSSSSRALRAGQTVRLRRDAGEEGEDREEAQTASGRSAWRAVAGERIVKD